jgi:hypothetical protein
VSGNQETRSATAERAAVPQVARCELRAWRSGSASSPRADCRRHGAYRPALPGFGAVEEPEDFYRTDYGFAVLPISRDPSPSSEIEVIIVH